MKTHPLAVLLCWLATALPAQAEVRMHCADWKKTVAVDILRRESKLISVARIDMATGEKKWSSRGEGTRIMLGQAFETKDRLWIDVANDAEEIIAELRLFKSSEGGTSLHAGTLRIAGAGAWAVECKG